MPYSGTLTLVQYSGHYYIHLLQREEKKSNSFQLANNKISGPIDKGIRTKAVSYKEKFFLQRKVFLNIDSTTKVFIWGSY